MPFFMAGFAVIANATPCQITPKDALSAQRVAGDALSIVDGDSLRYGHKKWRLLGVNTPEYNEPLADKAKALLAAALMHSDHLYWLPGEEPNDRYGRELGYLFDGSGQFVAANLLGQGLAFAVVVAPNVAYLACIKQNQASAKSGGLGIWRHGYFAPVDVGVEPIIRSGFGRWRGVLQAPVKNKAGVWLTFAAGDAVLHVPRKAQSYFSSAYLASLKGKRVEVTGWAVKRAKKSGYARWIMRVYHPLHITVLGQ